MNHHFDITLILPAFNEAARIRSTVEQALAYFDSRGMQSEIIVAADGNDGSREIIRDFARERPGVLVIGHPERRGKGRGIREAVAKARGEIVGFADADNKVAIEEYGKVERGLEAGFQVVIGSRAVSGSEIAQAQPLHRRLGGKAFGIIMRGITGLNVRDTQCGFKFFPAPVAHDLFGRQRIDGYMFDAEILYIAHRLGYSIHEVPVRWRDDGDSRLDLVSGNIRNMRDVLRIRRMHGRLSARQAVKSRVEVASR
jgi:glycosyltransferase involved in cell wall biosynthesis